MTAFTQFIFIACGFSALFNFIDLTDPTTMRGHKPKIAWTMAGNLFAVLWATWLLWGDV